MPHLKSCFINLFLLYLIFSFDLPKVIMASTDMSISDLLQQANQLTSHTDSSEIDDLPRVERTIHQLLNTASKTDHKISSTHDAQA